jgi:hypothetical protein
MFRYFVHIGIYIYILLTFSTTKIGRLHLYTEYRVVRHYEKYLLFIFFNKNVLLLLILVRRDKQSYFYSKSEIGCCKIGSITESFEIDISFYVCVFYHYCVHQNFISMLISVIYNFVFYLHTFSFLTGIYSDCLLSYQTDTWWLFSQTGQALHIHVSIYIVVILYSCLKIISLCVLLSTDWETFNEMSPHCLQTHNLKHSTSRWGDDSRLLIGRDTCSLHTNQVLLNTKSLYRDLPLIGIWTQMN